MNYFNTLDEETFDFNSTAGNYDVVTLQSLKNQYNFLLEEVNEIGEGLEKKDLEEILDGVVDVLVVITGFAHQLENLGIRVDKAVERITKNNLSKFPLDEDDSEINVVEVKKTTEKYKKEGVAISVSNRNGRYVFKDQNGKIRKPASFVPVELSDLVQGIELKDY